MPKTLITGANGFVGQALCRHLEAISRPITRAVRCAHLPNETEIGNIGASTHWHAALAGCDAIVHLAARVHVMHDTATDPLLAFREVNTQGTLHLARQAAAQRVRRFVFISSVKVNGESGLFSDGDAPSPQDAYALSKWEAEQGLLEIGRETGMEVVILRPPLVYGPRVGANFLRLMRAVDRGIPLPFGAVDNQRSLIYVGNFVDAMTICLDHPAAAGKTYLVSDGECVSTPVLIRQMAKALSRSPRLLPIPPRLMRFAGHLLGKAAEIDRLLGSLAVDPRAIGHDLGWTPPFSLEEGLAATANWYRQQAQ